jgi:WD40 repeat protein
VPAPVSDDPKKFFVKNARTDEILVALTEHEFTVSQIAFSPDGKLLATAGLDGQVIIWGVTKP